MTFRELVHQVCVEEGFGQEEVREACEVADKTSPKDIPFVDKELPEKAVAELRKLLQLEVREMIRSAQQEVAETN